MSEIKLKKNMSSFNIISRNLSDNETNLKSISKAEVLKTLFTKETGEAINKIKTLNSTLKLKTERITNKSLPKELKNINEKENIVNPYKQMEKEIYQSFSRNKPLYKESTNFMGHHKQSKNLQDTIQYIKKSSTFNKPIIIKTGDTQINNKDNIYLTQEGTETLSSKNIKEENEKGLKMIKRIKKESKESLYCPYCDHCKNIFEEELKSSKIFEIKESKNQIKRGLDYIIDTNQLHENEIINQPFTYSYTQIESNNKNKNIFQIEEFINLYNRHSLTRTNYAQTIHFLNSLIDDKLSLEHFINTEKINKLYSSFLSIGVAFDDTNGFLEFEKEIEADFEESVKLTIKRLFKSKIKIKNKKIFSVIITQILKKLKKKNFLN